jgi:hypothetical protein
MLPRLTIYGLRADTAARRFFDTGRQIVTFQVNTQDL